MSTSGFGSPPPLRGETAVPTSINSPGADQLQGRSPSGQNGAGADAKEQVGQVAGTAVEGAKKVADVAQSQAGEVLGDAADAARDVVHELRTELRQQASTQTQRAAEGLRTFAQQIEALRSGRPQDAGPAGDYARQLGEKIQALSQRVESGGFDGVVRDVRRFARRRPGAFLLGAAAAGFAVGRIVRSSTGNADDNANGAPRYPASYPTSYGQPNMLGQAPVANSGLEAGYGQPPVRRSSSAVGAADPVLGEGPR